MEEQLLRILIQLDSDAHPSVFDAVVALDSETDHLLQYGNVSAETVQGLVHGAMFTRGPSQLKHTAIFVGGSNVRTGEEIGQVIRKTFFGPIQVSVMLDGNGSNTTAAAAVLCAARHISLSGVHTVVLGGTGPVGARVASLLLHEGAMVRLCSRSSERANEATKALAEQLEIGDEQLQAIGTEEQPMAEILAGQQLLISCGAAGAQLVTTEDMQQATSLKCAIDLNAVPPAGIEGIGPTDKATERAGRLDYGAIGVGGLKMRIHQEAINTLFTKNDLFLDTQQIYEIGKELEASRSV